MKLRDFLALFCSAAVTSHGAVVVSTNNEVGPGGVGSTFTPSYAVSATDLINGLAPSAVGGNFAVTEITGGTPVLTDGVYGAITEPGGAADRTHLIFGIGGGGGGSGTFVTYTLNTAVNTLGYNISSIAVFGGWNDNGRDQQLYRAAYSVVGSPLFIDLPLVDFNPVIGANLQSATPDDSFRECPPVPRDRSGPSSLHLRHSGSRKWLRRVRRDRRHRRGDRARAWCRRFAPRGSRIVAARAAPAADPARGAASRSLGESVACAPAAARILIQMPRSSRDRMSRSAVSSEHFASFATFASRSHDVLRQG